MISNKKILIIYPPTNKNYGLYQDIINDGRVLLRCSSYREIKCRISYLFRKIHLSKIINRIINLPHKEYWYDYHDILNLLPNIQYILVIDLALNSPYLINIIKKCRINNKKVKIGLFYLNSIGTADTRPRFMEAINNSKRFIWDEIYTFDPVDSQKYNMKYLGFNYYSNYTIAKNLTPQNDLFCIGISSKDRENLFTEIYKRLHSAGCKCDFHLKVSEIGGQKIEGIDYIMKGLIPYKTVLNSLQNSKCILEILRDKQRGPSLRYFEAVCYNKKLLTNNPSIVGFPYYNEKYMKIFTKPDDIDINWLKEDITNVDYHYQGDFSPTKLIDFLIEKL